MQQLKSKKKWLPALIVAVFVGIIVILAIMFGFFQRQEVFDKYEVAYEIDGKLYEVFPISATDIGVDKKSKDKNLYFRVNSYYNIDYLFRLAYKQYEINEPSTNKYYSGLIDYSVADNAYVTQKDVYITNNESYATYDFFDKNGKKSILIIRKKPQMMTTSCASSRQFYKDTKKVISVATMTI